MTLYSVHVLVLALTDSDDPTHDYLVQVVAALVLTTLWRRYLGRGPLEAVIAVAVRIVLGRRT